MPFKRCESNTARCKIISITIKHLQNFNVYKMFYFKWNRFYYFENDRLLKAFSKNIPSAAWNDNMGTKCYTRWLPGDMASETKLSKANKTTEGLLVKKESNVYKPEFTLGNKTVTSSYSCSPSVSLFFLTSGKSMLKCITKWTISYFHPSPLSYFLSSVLFLYLFPSFLRTVN
jgi:hypothetical protein